MDPNENVRFENESSLEPLPGFRERTVVMRAVGAVTGVAEEAETKYCIP